MSNETEERLDVKIAGKKIGTGTGWDQVDDSAFVYYDFIPEEEYSQSLLRGDITVDLIQGSIYYYNEDGKIISQFTVSLTIDKVF